MRLACQKAVNLLNYDPELSLAQGESMLAKMIRGGELYFVK